MNVSPPTSHPLLRPQHMANKRCHCDGLSHATALSSAPARPKPLSTSPLQTHHTPSTTHHPLRTTHCVSPTTHHPLTTRHACSPFRIPHSPSSPSPAHRPSLIISLRAGDIPARHFTLPHSLTQSRLAARQSRSGSRQQASRPRGCGPRPAVGRS